MRLLGSDLDERIFDTMLLKKKITKKKIPTISHFVVMLSIYFLIGCGGGGGEGDDVGNGNSEYPIFTTELAFNLEFGIDSSEGVINWLFDSQDSMKMEYPEDQIWGVVFITVGHPTDLIRSSMDFSKYNTLSLDLRGEKGGEEIEIGIKDNTEPDDGSENKVKVCSLTSDWQTILIPLDKFATSNLQNLYIVVEFIFKGQSARTVYFKNVKYLIENMNESGVCENSDELIIYDGTLSDQYDIGVNSSGGLTDWFYDSNTFLKMEYPDNQTWGVVFITFGSLTGEPPNSMDLSAYGTLSVDLRGEKGGEEIEIGIKDKTDPDDGSETKIKVSDLTTEWETYYFSVEDFTTADLDNVYVLVEFVFSGSKGQTVNLKNVKYLK